MEKGSFEVKVGLAEMLKGGVIMDVTNAERGCRCRLCYGTGAHPG